MKIATKGEYLARSGLGLLGNRMPSWDTPEEAMAAGHRGLVMIRSRVPNSPHMRANIPVQSAGATIFHLVNECGARAADLYLTWMSPTVGRRINGEAWRGPNGLYLNYSTAQTHLREGLDLSGRHVEGVSARMVLEWACCPNSLADIDAILDLHPDAVIELTAFDREVGDIPGRNTVIWEVRDY